MKIIRFNKENIKNEEVEKVVKKSRGIILNEQGKALIVKYAGLYMFPGGKIENENNRDALSREILEEAGIEKIDLEDKPFLKLESYDRNYYTRSLGRNITRLTETYFYYGRTKDDINLKKQNLTQNERNQEFLVSFENLSIIQYLAQTNITDNKKIKNFNRELFTAMQEFANYQIEKQESLER